MWKIKLFSTREAMQQWIALNDNRCQWTELFVNNGFAVEFRALRRVY